jgi:hypothetical protein
VSRPEATPAGGFARLQELVVDGGAKTAFASEMHLVYNRIDVWGMQYRGDVFLRLRTYASIGKMVSEFLRRDETRLLIDLNA